MASRQDSGLGRLSIESASKAELSGITNAYKNYYNDAPYPTTIQTPNQPCSAPVFSAHFWGSKITSRHPDVTGGMTG